MPAAQFDTLRAASALGCLLLLASPAFANTFLFTNTGTACTILKPCGKLPEFGFLTGARDILQIKGNAVIRGGTGIDASSKLQVRESGRVVNDIVDFADPVAVARKLPGRAGANYSARLDSVEANGGVTVYNTAADTQTEALTVWCGGTICNIDDRVVVLLSGSSATFGADTTPVPGGLTSDVVTFYLPTTSLAIDRTVAAITISDDVVKGTGEAGMPIGAVYMLGGTVNGSGATYQVGYAPEPGTWGMMAAGVVGVLWGGNRRRNARRSVA
jgi:hypothetical protein